MNDPVLTMDSAQRVRVLASIAMTLALTCGGSQPASATTNGWQNTGG